MILPGARVAGSSWRPRRSFVGTVVSVGKRTAHVRLHCGRMRFVKLGRLRMQGGAWR
jgi:hypothetical protein